MAAKVKCPACGAKNALDPRRCRICTAIINPDIPDANAAPDEAPVPIPEPSFDAGQIDRQLGGSRAGFGGSSGLGARIAAAGNTPPAPERLEPAPAGSTTGFVSTDGDSAEDWSPEALWDSSAHQAGNDASFEGLAADASGPVPSDDESVASAAFEPFQPFDPDALFDSAPPPTDEAPAASPSPDFEPFDPDALFDSAPPPTDEAPAASPSPDFEPFDPDALFRDT